MRIPLRSKTRVRINNAVWTDFRRERIDNPVATLIDEMTIREVVALVGENRGKPPGSFPEPSLGSDTYCLTHHILFVRYTIRHEEELIGWFFCA